MVTYNPATDESKIRDAIQTIHGELRDRLGNGVTLADVTAKFNETYGLNWSEEKVAPYLDKGLQSRRAQGVSSTSTLAGVASDNAAQASADAREGNTVTGHATAAVTHMDAAKAHEAAANYHKRAAAWHDEKSAGGNPGELEGE